MINKGNISAYIRFLYKRKYSTEAPSELIGKWSHLNDAEIQENLSQLYTHWNYSVVKAKETELLFFNSVIKPAAPMQVPNKPISPPKQETFLEATPKKRSGWRIAFMILLPLLLLGGIYIAYQYMQYSKIHTIYTLTQNVAIRDEQGKTIGNFALLPNTRSKTYTELLVLDNDIYPLSIDSTSNKYDFRKVLFEKADFMSFLQNDFDYGFVNANYVIEDKETFTEYKRIFGKFQGTDNDRLKLAQRKIIYNVLKNSRKHRSSYLLSSCKNTNKKFSGFLSNELVENTRYQIIAKLEDGYFYSLAGDLNSDKYEEPERIQLDGNDCNADFLFRYISAQSGFKIYNCLGAALQIRLISNEDKTISSFETIITPPEPEPETEDEGGGILEDLFG